jgi:hypothetical protein
MRLRGEDTEEALREWFKAEIKEGPKQVYELGRFFFSVSSATMGFIVALAKTASSATLGLASLISMLFLLASVIVAIEIAKPRKHAASGSTELLDLYKNHLANYDRLLWCWFGLWLSGAVAGVWGVRW